MVETTRPPGGGRDTPPGGGRDTPPGGGRDTDSGTGERWAVCGAELTLRRWGEGAPTVVMAHDGLGSVQQWRTVPALLAHTTGSTVVAYNRPGHGDSSPVPDGPWPTGWMHDQADLLLSLLDELGADRPVLVGHSDGASISLLAAARRPEAVSAVLALAPHSWVEEVCVNEIRRMRSMGDRVPTALARFHSHPRALFDAWSGVWISDEFSRWDIRAEISAVTAPTVVVQGSDDEYATSAQATETTTAIGDNARCRLIPDAGHLLNHQVPDVIVAEIEALLAGG